METLTKTVDQMSESFAQPDVQKSFESWAERAGKEARQEEKKEQKRYETASERHEISLKEMSPEDREWFEKVGQRDESAKEPQKDAAKIEHSEKRENKPEAKAAEKSTASEPSNSPSEPLSGDRHWQNDVVPSEKELNDFRSRVESRAQAALEYINKHPEKEKIVQGLRGMTADKGREFEGDLHKSLAEVPNPGEVLRHLALMPSDREALRGVKDWKQLRAAIQTISKHYAAAAPDKKASEIRPRAPKPPSEVAGRAAAGDGGEMDFSSFEKNMNAQHYARHAR